MIIAINNNHRHRDDNCRLTPAYMVIVGLYLTWLPRLDSGPLWWRMNKEKERCRASWWANILYINNYVNTDQLVNQSIIP